jgi:FkbM family methyltransferase
MSSPLRDILSPSRLTEVVDVGASPLDGGLPPYRPLLASGLCRVTGFEPQEDALARLNATKGPSERYFPYVVGDGAPGVLHVCAGTGMTSLLEPDPATLRLFAALVPLAEVTARVPVATRRLDDIEEVAEIDFLKTDVQGAELAVFRSGKAKLANAVAIHTEVSFVTLYRGQPSFGDVDVELRAQGFLPHCFTHIKPWPVAPAVINGDPRTALRQLLEADVVYARDISKPEAMSDEQLKQLAIIVDHCYGSFDLALRCVMLLEQRGAVKPGAEGAYMASVQNRAVVRPR